MMNIFKTTAIAAALLGSVTVAQAATVDFGGFSSGDVLGTGVDLGGGIVADITAVGGINQAVIFNTVPPVTGGDVDLASPFVNSVTGDPRSFGNALIVQENAGNPIVPDDAVGGSLLFGFASVIALGEVFLLDTAEDTYVNLLLNGVLVASQTVQAFNDSDTANNVTPNEFTLFDFGGAQGDTLFVSFSESGALGEFTATVVPLPAGLPLLLGGIGAFAWMKRRKRA